MTIGDILFQHRLFHMMKLEGLHEYFLGRPLIKFYLAMIPRNMLDALVAIILNSCGLGVWEAGFCGRC